MAQRDADPSMAQAIKRLAGEPEAAAVSTSAYYDMMGASLTVEDVCDAIVDWIDQGKRVQEIVTKHAKGRIGKPAFVMKPRMLGTGYYVKVAVEDPGGKGERLTIVSAHPHH